MRSESTSAFGQPRLTKPTFGARLGDLLAERVMVCGEWPRGPGKWGHAEEAQPRGTGRSGGGVRRKRVAMLPLPGDSGPAGSAAGGDAWLGGPEPRNLGVSNSWR